MNNSEKYNSPKRDFDELTNDFFGKAQIPYELSKEDVWKRMDLKPRSVSLPNSHWLSTHKTAFAIAATIVVLVAVFSVLRFYTFSIHCPPAQHLTTRLPDGSTVNMNANSYLSYKPYWWRFSRTVNFEGEGFFNVEQGEKFQVSSGMAATVVLGTSFNIYARNNSYEVTCYTGKVRVVSKNNDEGILIPGYKAKLSNDGKVLIYKNEDTGSTISWIDNRFIFTAVQLRKVFEEIERQYNVRINLPAEINYTYTGYFTKDKPIEEVLELVCKPFGLTFVTKSENTFDVKQQD